MGPHTLLSSSLLNKNAVEIPLGKAADYENGPQLVSASRTRISDHGKVGLSSRRSLVPRR